MDKALYYVSGALLNARSKLLNDRKLCFQKWKYVKDWTGSSIEKWVSALLKLWELPPSVNICAGSNSTRNSYNTDFSPGWRKDLGTKQVRSVFNLHHLTLHFFHRSDWSGPFWWHFLLLQRADCKVSFSIAGMYYQYEEGVSSLLILLALSILTAFPMSEEDIQEML